MSRYASFSISRSKALIPVGNCARPKIPVGPMFVTGLGSGLPVLSSFSKYSAKDLNGNNIVGEVEGLHARVIQHEFDHLNGVLYTSRLAHKSAFGYSDEIEKFLKKNNDENKK